MDAFDCLNNDNDNYNSEFSFCSFIIDDEENDNEKCNMKNENINEENAISYAGIETAKATSNDSNTNGKPVADTKAKELAKKSERHCTLIRKKYPRSPHIIPDPKTLAEAFSSEYAEEWRIAANEEMKNLKMHDTFKIVKKPKYCHQIKTRFVFHVKYNKDGEVHKFKARLVACGYNMIFNLEFTDTFAPVANESTIKFLMAYGAKN